MAGTQHRQRGAALVLVLAMLSMALMLGLSGISSSLVNERLAGNYRTATQAQMAAEAGAATGMADPDKNFLGPGPVTNGDDIWSSWVQSDDGRFRRRYTMLNPAGLQAAMDEGLVPVFDLPAGSRFLIGQGQVNDRVGDINRYILVSYASGGAPNLDAVFTCFGLECSHNADGHLHGEDHPLPDSFNCTGASCRTTPEPDRDTDLDVPAFAHFAPDHEEYSVKRDFWEAFIAELPAPDASFSSGSISFDGSRDAPSVIEITGNVKMNGNQATAGIIIVRAGATLDKANGTAHHEGLILVEEGGNVSMATGTFNLYGGIVMLKSEDASGDGEGGGKGKGNDKKGSDLDAKGNSALRYSTAAVSLLDQLLPGGSGPTGWREL
ncbi:pilus assembly PilX family protein [Billgrantia sp. C5P2]|uniref:pilus assembly PilX family protein n=1 Tax=Billgrantia sp. C5P2 TaxID=3436239 RepID=UPI003DA2C05A